jgi:hypothetical protein
MELVGEEKKITALFSELKLADESMAPQFGVVWNRAQAQTVRSYRAFNLSFVAATALLVCTLVALAWWSRSLQRSTPQQAFVVAPPTSATSPTPRVQRVESAPEKLAVTTPRRFNAKHGLKALTRSESATALEDQSVTREAIAISKWQSPTSVLLSSSSDEIITSLPQLNENANDLKSFLPNRPK